MVGPGLRRALVGGAAAAAAGLATVGIDLDRGPRRRPRATASWSCRASTIALVPRRPSPPDASASPSTRRPWPAPTSSSSACPPRSSTTAPTSPRSRRRAVRRRAPRARHARRPRVDHLPGHDRAGARAPARGRRACRPAVTSCSPTRRSGSTPATTRFPFARRPPGRGRRDTPRRQRGGRLLRRARREVHPVSSCRAAELAKLLENTYRLVNIALVNELAQLCADQGIDTWEVIDAAATKPFGFQRFYPGPGVGGHCIPLDPAYLTWQSRRDTGRPFRLVELAKDINDQMPAYVARRIVDALNDRRHRGPGRARPRPRRDLQARRRRRPRVGGRPGARAPPRRGARGSLPRPLRLRRSTSTGCTSAVAASRRRRSIGRRRALLTPHSSYDLDADRGTGGSRLRCAQRHRVRRPAERGGPVTRSLPAILGGEPAFPERLPLVRPTIDDVRPLASDSSDPRVRDAHERADGARARGRRERAPGVAHAVAVVELHGRL